MRDTEVPQDEALFDGQKELCYAIDDKGRYVLTPSVGWEPANVANHKAWEVVFEEVETALANVRLGIASPLAWHMAKHQMDPALLAKYVGLYRWQVRRHMKPGPFRRLSKCQLEKYAAIFSVSSDELCRLPEPGQ